MSGENRKRKTLKKTGVVIKKLSVTPVLLFLSG